MTITPAGTNVSNTGTAKPLTASHTLVAGANRLIMVGVGVENANATGTYSATYGGVAMSGPIQAAEGAGFENDAVLFWLGEADLPADGANTASVTFTGTAGSLEINLYVAQYDGVDTSAASDSDTNNGTSSPIANTISGAADDLLFSVLSSGNTGTGLTWDNSQNELIDFADGSSRFGVAELIATGSISSLNTTVGGSINRLARAAIAFSPAAAGDGDTRVGGSYAPIGGAAIAALWVAPAAAGGLSVRLAGPGGLAGIGGLAGSAGGLAVH